MALVSQGSSGNPLIATMDTLVESVHFFAEDPPWTLGKKLLRVNVSDIICKGALPRQALLSVALPKFYEEAAFESFCMGLGEDLLRWGVDLIGGDLVTTSGPMTLTLALTGECVSRFAVHRNGASANDDLFVTGVVGEGILGLDEVRSGRLGAHSEHYRVPRIPALSTASLVAEYASSSIDISDGLLSDTKHLSDQSGIGVELRLDHVPWAAACNDVEDMLRLATGGDDYQTLVTIPNRRSDSFRIAARELGLSVTCIGHTTTAGLGLSLKLNGAPVIVPQMTGFNHLKT